MVWSVSSGKLTEVSFCPSSLPYHGATYNICNNSIDRQYVVSKVVYQIPAVIYQLDIHKQIMMSVPFNRLIDLNSSLNDT